MITLFKVHMPESVLKPVNDVLMSGFIGEGPKVKEFEAGLADVLGNRNVLTTNSGTSALQLSLRLAGVESGDEVISTAMTCTATNEPILAAGAKIVWADINPKTGNICPDSIRSKITSKTKAIMAVHWGGSPVDLDEINAIAKEHHIKVIEDAAHGFGSDFQGQKIGNHSDYVCFSFQAIKHITTVDGGALLCRSEEDYQRGKLLRWYGIDRESNRKDFRCEEDIEEWGYKFHMNDVAATIGIEQLKYAAGLIEQRQAQAGRYRELLTGVPGVELLQERTDAKSAYWLYTLLVERDQDFMTMMQAADIMVSKVHARNDTHTMFREFRCDLPNLDQFYRQLICIPIGYWVTEENQDYIVDKIKAGW